MKYIIDIKGMNHTLFSFYELKRLKLIEKTGLGWKDQFGEYFLLESGTWNEIYKCVYSRFYLQHWSALHIHYTGLSFHMMV